MTPRLKRGFCCWVEGRAVVLLVDLLAPPAVQVEAPLAGPVVAQAAPPLAPHPQASLLAHQAHQAPPPAQEKVPPPPPPGVKAAPTTAGKAPHPTPEQKAVAEAVAVPEVPALHPHMPEGQYPFPSPRFAPGLPVIPAIILAADGEDRAHENGACSVRVDGKEIVIVAALSVAVGMGMDLF